jgi:hypothetical protein
MLVQRTDTGKVNIDFENAWMFTDKEYAIKVEGEDIEICNVTIHGVSKLGLWAKLKILYNVFKHLNKCQINFKN